MRQAGISIAFALLWGAPTAGGCAAARAPATRKPEVAQVTVPLEASSTAAARPSASFRCDEPALGETTRVEFRVQSAERDGSTSAQTRAVYTITPRTESGQRLAGAEIVLESLSTDTPDRAQSAWTVGIDAGWISLRRPFAILRDGGDWCLADACDDATQREFAAAIGDTAELIALPELAEQLTRAEDASALTLPTVLLKRMGLGTIDPDRLSATAERRGLDFPARFVVERGAPAAADMTSSSEPSTRAELLISRNCRLVALKVELARTGVTAQGSMHRFSWSFDPVP